ncbi:hypothetical protein C9J01_02875 [Photobacterium rosenbergii]|uniref:Uncharacterized protein n=1 Tax=Photobacterium rosenbergii TaxID=294936 RepID=A0A2T3NKC9_9GAMM|nr:hypothetical protein [Photobacterium rosenbergii]PSW15968.1 hypothetical protein C9J01_02875 [Photobacterium rosenbergii]
MIVWVGIVSSILITSSFTSGLTSALLDLLAFVIILTIGINRLKAKHQAKRKASIEQQDSKEFREEAKQINSVSDRIDITP